MSVDPLVPRPIDLPTPVPLEPDADLSVLDDAKILAAPDDPAAWPAWRDQISAWAAGARGRHSYDGGMYDDPAIGWAGSARVVALVWLWDELLYDHVVHRFTVDTFVEDARRRFGGLDGVVLWHAYPVIGIDPRNQYDYYRDVPELAAVVEGLQRSGIRVFLDYNPWDVGTRRPTRSDPEECAALITETGADGLFLDTLKEGDPALVSALATVGRPVALEGESRLPLARITDHALSWAQWFADSAVPGVLRAHVYERRHMLHHTRRWNRDHSDELQSAWLNGCGILVWESVFGSWVGWNARDASTLRRMRVIFETCDDLLISGTWTPLADLGETARRCGIFGSEFADAETTLTVLANRSDTDVTMPLLVAPPGRRLLGWDGDPAAVTVPARGVAAMLQCRDGALPERVATLTRRIRDLPDDVDSSFPARLPSRKPVAPATGDAPVASVRIVRGSYPLRQTYRRRETGWYGRAPYVEEWKPLPPRLHDDRSEEHEAVVGDVAVDAREVSRAEFHRFVAEAGYRPVVGHRFAGNAEGDPESPAVMVDLDDARAYAAWRGARLPTEFEWQIAASAGGFGRRTPLVWNWTESEHTDGRTRFVILKGGSDFAAVGSDWYTDGGPRAPEFTLQIPLLGAGLARSGCIGFRCVVDLAGDPAAPPDDR